MVDVETMLEDAWEKVHQEMGGLGSLDKELEKRLKYGLHRVEWFLHEIWSTDLQGRNRKAYLKKLAKDVLEDVPAFTDPAREGRSFVRELETMIDRKRDIEEIVGLLLSDDSEDLVSIVPILGIDGTGKTTLARLVYYHQRVQSHFDYKLWVDIDGVGSAEELLLEVCRELRVCKDNIKLLDQLQKELDGKKCLLVLGDLPGDQDFRKWIKLLEPLLPAFATCRRGSKILVTSRSTSVDPRHLLHLPMVKDGHYLLEPLQKNVYLALLQSIASRGIAEEDKDADHLIDTRFRILNKCAKDLLTITTMASILSCEPANQEKWQYFHSSLLPTVKNPVESIRSVMYLMQKETRLFLTYSSLFPLNYKFSKLELQQLYEGHIPSEAVPMFSKFDICFEKLLAVGYIVENGRDKNGVLVYYSIAQSLMYEVVKHVASYTCVLLDKPTKEVDAQHVSFIVDSSWGAPSWLYDAKLLKSLLFLPREPCEYITIPNIHNILTNLKYLEVLDLAYVNCISSQECIKELKQLKYLRLGMSFESLPEFITKFMNLTTLDLRHTAIQELPENFHQLSSLRHLYTGDRLID